MNVTTVTLPRTGLTFEEAEMLNRQSIRNEALLASHGSCGCFHCGALLPSQEIVEWIEEDDGGKTALCPRCGVDSLIFGTDSHPLTVELLARMHAKWFFEEEMGLQEGKLIAPAHKEEDYYRLGIAFHLEPLPTEATSIELLGYSTWRSYYPDCKRDENAEILMEKAINGSIIIIDALKGKTPSFRLENCKAELPLKPFRFCDEEAIERAFESFGNPVRGIVLSRDIQQGNSAPADPEFHYRIYSYKVALIPATIALA